MSAKQIRAAKRSLSPTEVVSCVRHRHRFVMGLLCKALHFGIVIYGYSFWELIQVITAIKWHSWKSYRILWKCYLSHPEHPYIADPCCTLLWKISTPVCLQMLFETIFFSFRLPHYFIFRSCFQMACRGLLNDYSVESTSEPILFPWAPNLSLLPVPENFTVAISFSLCCSGSARGTFSLRCNVSYCCSPRQPGEGKSESP